MKRFLCKKESTCKYYILFSGKPLPHTHLFFNILWGFLQHNTCTSDQGPQFIEIVCSDTNRRVSYIHFICKVQWAVYLWCLNYRPGVGYKGEFRTHEIDPHDEGGGGLLYFKKQSYSYAPLFPW